jgi:ATP-binding cassette subfamily B (MDR/TAP) protein 1
LLFFILGIASFLLTTLQLGFFNIVGEDITLKLRSEVFLKLMKMPIAWFDVPRNNSGTLAARLSTDCSQVNSLATTVIGIMLQNISSLITGIVIGFVFDWRTTLVAIGLMPFLILAGLLEMQYQTGQNDQTSEGYKDSSSLIMEAMMNIRTVSSSGHDYIIVKKY